MKKKEIVLSGIDRLIKGYFAQQLDNSELKELLDWIMSSNENKRYFIQKQEDWFSPVGTNNDFHFI
jgi:hypothetical protein